MLVNYFVPIDACDGFLILIYLCLEPLKSLLLRLSFSFSSSLPFCDLSRICGAECTFLWVTAEVCLILVRDQGGLIGKISRTVVMSTPKTSYGRFCSLSLVSPVLTAFTSRRTRMTSVAPLVFIPLARTFVWCSTLFVARFADTQVVTTNLHFS